MIVFIFLFYSLVKFAFDLCPFWTFILLCPRKIQLPNLSEMTDCSYSYNDNNDAENHIIDTINGLCVLKLMENDKIIHI